MSQFMPIAEKIDAYNVDGQLFRIATDDDVSAQYPDGHVSAVVGKRVCVLVPLVKQAPDDGAVDFQE